MSYIVGIGHRIGLRDILDKFSFEDFDEAKSVLSETGLDIFLNESDDVFVTISDKYKIVNGDYVDCDFSLTAEEIKLLSEYTGKTDQRIKIFKVDWSSMSTDYDEDQDDVGFDSEIALVLRLVMQDLNKPSLPVLDWSEEPSVEESQKIISDQSEKNVDQIS